VADQDEDLLAQLLLRWEELAERGQDSSAKELAKDRPDLADELERRILALKATSWLAEPLDDDPPLLDPDPDHDPHPTPSSRPLGRRYRLDALVGEGGFAQVYRAYDLGLHRTVAVKIPKPSRSELTSTFLEEARRIAQLKHDSIVAVYDVGVEDRNAFIVSEFMEGGNLAQRLAKGTLKEEEAVRWIAEIADALQYAHANGVLHRDLKPANLLIDHHGKAKLADFGIAGKTSGSGASPNHFGTLPYMSPEQLSGSEGDARSDIYGLAVVMYEALTGRPPPASSARGTDWLAFVPKGLRKICQRALNPDPMRRHASAGEFANDLRRVGTSRQRRRVASWVTGLCGVALAVGLLVAPGSRQALAMWLKSLRGAPVARISVTGFGDRQFLPGTLPLAWAKEGVLAEIRESGILTFETLNESAFVLDIDLEMRNPRGHVTIATGEPNTFTDICLGRRAPADEIDPRIACRLVRAQQTGNRWFEDDHLPAGQRLTLQLFVADDLKFLVRDREVLTHVGGDANNCRVWIVADRDVSATIYGMSVRPLTPEDAKWLGCQFPVRQVEADVVATKERLDKQNEGITKDRPVTDEDYCLADPWLPMKWIGPAEYAMGSPTEPLKRQGGGEERVKITRGYWIGRYEATQGLWESVMETNPSRVTGTYAPVNFISWSDACEFCRRFTEQEREKKRVPEGYEYRLPTEAEWEYACRAGEVPPGKQAVMGGIELYQTHPHEIGTSPPNPWGLYEMVAVLPDETSNVPEWCLDRFEWYPSEQKDVTVDRFHPGKPRVDQFVVRGGRDGRQEVFPHPYARFYRDDNRGGFRGFRVALGPTINIAPKDREK
jgi:formylglycine-generating enzyme required for sulfatase activity/tRNA A-37 threonylcarbamoyl transferase component Bud32